jgi:hypothetical protein
MRMAWAGVVCWLGMGLAWAGDGHATRLQVEATMTVSGSLRVDDTGRVTASTIDHPEQLPAGVVQLVQQTLPTFHFQPVLHDGQPQPVEATMTLVIAANRIDPKQVAIRLRSARFTEAGTVSGEWITVAQRGPLHFPEEAILSGVGGTAYVAVRIDRSGRVLDAQVQQVNLRAADDARQMRHWREAVGKAAVATVRGFTFNVPTHGSHAGDPDSTGIVPVRYSVGIQAPPKYGQWDSYVPGPIEQVDWMQAAGGTGIGANEAIPDGLFAQAGSEMTLLTPLDGG